MIIKPVNIKCPIHKNNLCLRLKEGNEGLPLLVVEQEFDAYDVICIESGKVVGTVNIKITTDESSLQKM